MTMKQWLRRSLAALLTVALLLGVAPLPSAQAEVVQPVGPLSSHERLSQQAEAFRRAPTGRCPGRKIARRRVAKWWRCCSLQRTTTTRA